MIYFILFSLLAHLNYAYLYSMQENQENPSVQKLMTFVKCENTDEYLNWTYQPLADNFKKNNAWSEDIVLNLLSPDQKAYQKANKNCQILLNAISNNKNQLYERQKKADRHREVYIIFPYIALFVQLYCNLYQPFGSLCIMEITGHCTATANALEDVSRAFSRHGYQLHLIENEISTTINKIQDPEQRQDFITQLIQNHGQEKKVHANIIDFLEQKPLSAKKND